jgi:hypothetical protein
MKEKSTTRWIALLEGFKIKQQNICIISLGCMPIKGIIQEVHLDYIEIKTTMFNPNGEPIRSAIVYVPLMAVVGIEVSSDLKIKEGEENENSISL